MAMRNSTLVGVFDERAQAENAIEQLHSAGIPDDQITYSGSTASAGSGFVAAIKSFFTGGDTSANVNSLFSDLTGMGLSQDEAQYYANQYQVGHAILAVNAAERWQDAQVILTSNGAYTYRTQQSDLSTQPAGGYAQPGSATNYTQNPMPGYAQDDNQNYNRTAQNATPEYTQSDSLSNDSMVQNAAPGYAQADNQNYNRTAQNMTPEYTQTGGNYDQTAQAPDYTQANAYNQPGMTNDPAYDEEARIERRPYGDSNSTNTQDSQDETFRVPVRQDQMANTNQQNVGMGETAPDRRSQEQQRVFDRTRRQETYVDNDGNVQTRESNTDQDNY